MTNVVNLNSFRKKASDIKRNSEIVINIKISQAQIDDLRALLAESVAMREGMFRSNSKKQCMSCGEKELAYVPLVRCYECKGCGIFVMNEAILEEKTKGKV